MRKFIFLVVSMVFLAAGCNKTQPVQDKGTGNAPQPASLESTTEVSDWKICNNVKVGYSVKYPGTWHTFTPAAGEAKIDISCETEERLGYKDSITRVFFAPDYSFKSRLIVDAIPLEGSLKDLNGYMASKNIKKNAVVYTKLDKIHESISFTESNEQHILTVYNGQVFDLIGENIDEATFKNFTSSFTFKK